MNEIIKERNELAKQLFIHNNISIKSCLNEANKMMSLLYGNNWNNEDEHDYATNYQPATIPIVSIAEQDGMKGVRLCVGDVDIFIEPQDLDNGNEFEWQDAMDRLKELGKGTFTQHQVHMMAVFKDEINEKLREIGGKELDDTYWSSTEYTRYFAWNVNFSSGSIGYNGKGGTYVVRPVNSIRKE